MKMVKKYKKSKIRIESKSNFNLDKELEKLELCIKKNAKKNANVDRFELLLSAALVKTFECCVACVETKERDVFFLIASLRGICEDFISLKFIYEYLSKDKDQILLLSTLAETYKSSISQWKFFSSKKPSQRLYYKPEFEKELIEIREKLKALISPHPIKKRDHLPSVWYMAEKTGLSDVYQYIYHASSSFVHFNPRILFRMGWGDLPEITFSSRNFSGYYKDFLIFYGTYLHIELIKWAISINYLKSDDELPIKPFEDFLKKKHRWPELVTFEEMNVGALSRALFFGSPETPFIPKENENE